MRTDARIFVAGSHGMVGSAVVRQLLLTGYSTLLTPSRGDVELTDASAVSAFYRAERPEIAIICAAKVGGIHANSTYPADFLHDNLAIALNCIHEAHRHDCARLLFLGSSCIYPRNASQPLREDSLLTGPLESTNEAYAIAKIAGLKLCDMYRRQYGRLYHSAMPTNLYGPGDNYHLENSHVIPALMRRIHEAKTQGEDHVVLWGTGSPRRDFLHADDLSAGLLHLLNLEEPPPLVNIGSGTDVSILELARLLAEIIGFTGRFDFDPGKPDGTPVKQLDISKIQALGWHPTIPLKEGLTRTYALFCAGGYRSS